MECTTTLPAISTQVDTFPEDLLFEPGYYVGDEGFIVDTLDKATWATDRYLAAGHRMQERETLALTYKNRIDIWLEKANKADRDTQDFMQYLLTPYVQDYLSRQKKGKSFRVLGARLGFRKSTDRLEVIDPDSAIEYCREHLPDVLIEKIEIGKAIAKSYLADGFDIPGLAITEGHEELVIKELDDGQD